VLSLAPYDKLAFLVAGSLFLHAAGTMLDWRLRPYHQEVRSGGWQVLLEIVRLLFFAGLPIAALFLFRDIALPSAMGLTNVNWFASIGLGVPLGVGGGGLLLAGWWYYARSLSALPPSAVSRPSAGRPPKHEVLLLVEAVCLELHWAFYRSLPLLALDNRYLGVLLGLALVGLEWLLNPAWRHAWRQIESAEEVVPETTLAALMAVIYLFTQNLWLCILIHWLTSLCLDRLRLSLPGARC
jgi:hypothetical protein